MAPVVVGAALGVLLGGYARRDLEMAGVTIRAGELVLFDNGAANHDAVVFPDPARVDITRSAATHLSFGHGSRCCIGAPLARIELQAVCTHHAAHVRVVVRCHDIGYVGHPAPRWAGIRPPGDPRCR